MLDSSTNPFVDSEEIISLFSGVKANEGVAADLLHAHAKGQKAFEEFLNTRLLAHTVDFHARLPQLKLKTFASQLKEAKVRNFYRT